LKRTRPATFEDGSWTVKPSALRLPHCDATPSRRHRKIRTSRGYATSAVAGAPFKKPLRDGLDELLDWLHERRVATWADEAILKQCRSYLVVLQSLHEALPS